MAARKVFYNNVMPMTRRFVQFAANEPYPYPDIDFVPPNCATCIFRDDTQNNNICIKFKKHCELAYWRDCRGDYWIFGHNS